MSKTALDVMDDVSKSLAAHRRVLRLVESIRFYQAYNAACEKCRNDMTEIIARNDDDALNLWIRDQLNQRYSGMGIRELRETGKKFGIPNYCRLPKPVLLSEIVKHAEATASRDQPSGSVVPGNRCSS